MFSGRFPSCRCLPAAAMRQPFGSIVVPSDCAPGVAIVETGGPDCTRVQSTPPKTADAETTADAISLRIVPGLTILWTIKELFVCGVRAYTIKRVCGFSTENKVRRRAD